jgi:hypothetical protein
LNGGEPNSIDQHNLFEHAFVCGHHRFELDRSHHRNAELMRRLWRSYVAGWDLFHRVLSFLIRESQMIESNIELADVV